MSASERHSDVMIGFVHPALVHAQFMTSVMRAVDYGRYRVLGVESGPNVAGARNEMVRIFLESTSLWLFIVDSDIVFNPDAINRLLARGKKIISGLVYVNGDPPFPMAYKRMADIAVGMPLFMAVDVPDSGAFEVDAVGTSCVLVHRSVFLDMARRLPNPAAQWFQETAVAGNLIGEDMTFCDRAQQIGHSIWVDADVQMGHIKPHVIGKVV